MKQAKVFFLICAGVLMLAIAANLSTLRAYADSGDRTVALVDLETNNQGSYYFLTDTGELWIYRSPEGWWQEAVWPGDVPVERTNWSQVKSRFGR